MESQETPETIDQNLLSKYPNLKRRLPEGCNISLLNNQNYKPWTKENIIEGFRKYYDDYKKYPTAYEICTYQYLPTPRQIQRIFGGLVNIRKEIGLDVINYSIGQSRSNIAKKVGSRGISIERKMEKILIKKFGECFVHIEKPLYKFYKPGTSLEYKNKIRADFFVYAKGYKFCVDVFYPENNHSLKMILNNKAPKYAGLEIDTFLVNMNNSVYNDQADIEFMLSHKVTKLDSNIYLIGEGQFLEKILKIPRLRILSN